MPAIDNYPRIWLEMAKSLFQRQLENVNVPCSYNKAVTSPRVIQIYCAEVCGKMVKYLTQQRFVGFTLGASAALGLLVSTQVGINQVYLSDPVH